MAIKIKAPSYYKRFKCIAEKCRHSCCIGWRIEIDQKTKEKYDNLNGKTAKKLQKNITTDADCSFFSMKRDGRCPFLNKKGLCEIILDYGEEYLSDICREHPRFYNHAGECMEVGIGISCEEAARIILSSDDFDVLETVGETGDEAIIPEFDALTVRDNILRLLNDTSLSYREKLTHISHNYSVDTSVLSEEVRNSLYSELEYLCEENRAVFSDISFTENLFCEKKMTRFLAYMIFRHLTVADSMLNLRARLGFCLISAEIINALSQRNKHTIEDLARIYSEEIEYSENNTDSIIFEIECNLD